MLQALFSDAAATALYVDALAVVEFVATFGKMYEAPPISLPQLQQAVAKPVDHPALGQLYHTLLSCVLLDQVCCLTDHNKQLLRSHRLLTCGAICIILYHIMLSHVMLCYIILYYIIFYYIIL